MDRKIIIGIGVALAVLLGTGAALAVSGQRSHHSVAHHRTARHVALARSLDARIVKHLKLFRTSRAASSATSISAPLRAMFNAHIAPMTGANLDLAREAQTPTGPLYIVPGNGEICQIGGGGIGCGHDAKLGKDPGAYALFGSSMNNPPNTIDVSGIAADDVTSIDAVLPDGTAVAVPVSNNAYSSLIPANATTLEYHTTDQGTVSSDIPHTPPPPGR